MKAVSTARRAHARGCTWLLETPLRRRLLVVDGLALVAGALCLLLALARRPTPLGLAAALALLVLGRSVRVPLRLGERRVLVSAYSEGAILLTVLLVPAAWAPLLAGLVTFVGQLPRRVPLWRAAFNASALLGPVAVAAGAYSLVAGDGGALWRVVLGLVLACPLISLLNLAAVSSVVAAAHQEPWLQLARP